MKARALLLVLALVAAAVALGLACAPSGFTPEQQIASVRILASRADHDESYARPGDTVTLEALPVDGRAHPTGAMRLYWLPFLCENPSNDEYYACFAGAADGGAGGLLGAGALTGEIDAGASGGQDAGEDGGGGSNGAPPASPTLTFTVPADAISSHPVVAGEPAPYGLMIAFNVACAGTVKITSINPSAGPQQVPIACVDDQGNALGPDDYVIGFTRVYVYESVTNKNPEVDGIVVNGAETPTGVVGTVTPEPLDLDLPACTASSCASVTLDMDVPTSSWEIDPNTRDSSGNPEHESLWVDYFTITGNLGDGARLLYDSQAGRVTGTGSTVNYTPPPAGNDTLWAVVHDSRDGVTWLQVNVHTH